MNTINSHSIAGRSLGLVLSLVLAGSVYAGPGPQYWQSIAKPAARPAISAPVAMPFCPACRTVAVTAMVPSQANGRGPLHAVQIGTERVCAMCGGTATTLKASWQNARGPSQIVTVAATHNCLAGCCVPAPRA